MRLGVLARTTAAMMMRAAPLRSATGIQAAFNWGRGYELEQPTATVCRNSLSEIIFFMSLPSLP
jgi:hypothetical protein